VFFAAATFIGLYLTPAFSSDSTFPAFQLTEWHHAQFLILATQILDWKTYTNLPFLLLHITLKFETQS
jgi:hypothetical protein